MESALDRVEPQRADESWIAGLWADSAKVIPVDERGELFTDEANGGLAITDADGPFDSQKHLLLGLIDGVPHFSTVGELNRPTASLRAISAQLSPTLRDAATSAVALHNWHHLAPYCGVCGGFSAVKAGGHMRVCTQCGRDRFPRTDPAMIVAITDTDDRILLARPASWIPRRMSLVAGFVEAGECLEQAVVREVHEEVGLSVTQVRYLASQSWPVPRSLMVGFHAIALDTSFAIDEIEVEQAQWFSREEMSGALADGSLLMPGESSIAYRIITAWRNAPLEQWAENDPS